MSSHLLVSAFTRRCLVARRGGGRFIRSAMVLVDRNETASCDTQGFDSTSRRHYNTIHESQPAIQLNSTLYFSTTTTSSTSDEEDDSSTAPPQPDADAGTATTTSTESDDEADSNDTDDIFNKYFIGKVKFYDRKKGYGFIVPGGQYFKHNMIDGYQNTHLIPNHEDIFIHRLSIKDADTYFIKDENLEFRPYLNRNEYVKFKIELNTHTTPTTTTTATYDDGKHGNDNVNNNNSTSNRNHRYIESATYRAKDVTFCNGKIGTYKVCSTLVLQTQLAIY